MSPRSFRAKAHQVIWGPWRRPRRRVTATVRRRKTWAPRRVPVRATGSQCSPSYRPRSRSPRHQRSGQHQVGTAVVGQDSRETSDQMQSNPPCRLLPIPRLRLGADLNADDAATYYGVHEERPVSSEGGARLRGVHSVIDRDGDHFAIIDPKLGLQLVHVGRQLTTILRSVVSAAKDQDGREATNQFGQLL